jgi:hypothetical protein
MQGLEKSRLRHADANGRRNGQGQALFELRQPALLIEHQLGRDLAAGKAQGQLSPRRSRWLSQPEAIGTMERSAKSGC